MKIQNNSFFKNETFLKYFEPLWGSAVFRTKLTRMERFYGREKMALKIRKASCQLHLQLAPTFKEALLYLF